MRLLLFAICCTTPVIGFSKEMMLGIDFVRTSFVHAKARSFNIQGIYKDRQYKRPNLTIDVPPKYSDCTTYLNLKLNDPGSWSVSVSILTEHFEKNRNREQPYDSLVPITGCMVEKKSVNNNPEKLQTKPQEFETKRDKFQKNTQIFEKTPERKPNLYGGPGDPSKR